MRGKKARILSDDWTEQNWCEFVNKKSNFFKNVKPSNVDDHTLMSNIACTNNSKVLK